MKENKKNEFQWEKADQIGFFGLVLASFIPSFIAFTGFRFLLPELVHRNVSILSAYGITASLMLFGFSFVAIGLINKESGKLKISFFQRLCFKKINRKELFLSLAVLAAVMVLTIIVQPASLWIVKTFNVQIPSFYPFFLDPGINPAEVDPMLLTGGISLSGRWDVLVLLCITLFLNIVVEESYFRAWLLPKLSRFGKVSWILNAVFFTLYHSYQLWLAPQILVASLGFAFMNYKVKSIIPSFAAHLLLNTISIISLFPLFL